MGSTKLRERVSVPLHLIDFKPSEGRFLTAAREIPPGVEVIAEKSFSSVLLHNITTICSYCYKPIVHAISCPGCLKSPYCSVECRSVAWKCYHWLECFIALYLEKATVETALALRTLLSAAYCLTNESALSTQDPNTMNKIAKDMIRPSGLNTTTNQTVHGNYLGIYHLQTHCKEKETERSFHLLHKEIKVLTKLLIRCSILYDELLNLEKGNKESDNMPEQSTATLLQSAFERLSLSSYAKLDYFDIRIWKVVLGKYSKESKETDIDPSTKSIKEVFFQPPSSLEDIFERLLMRHALQVRTNGQAIFELQSSAGMSPVCRLEQQRLATGFFPTMSMMNHSCCPNTTISFDGRHIRVIASRKISKGEEISHCYGPHFSKHSLIVRQETLKTQYFFTCKCKICDEDMRDADKAIFRMQFHAFKCGQCGDPIKPDSTEQKTSGKCINEECREHQNITRANSKMENFKRDYVYGQKLLEKGEIRAALTTFQAVLKSMQCVLYRNHVDIGELNDQIAQCYIILHDYPSAIPHLTKSIAISAMLYGTDSVEIAHEYQKLASLHFNIGIFKLAASYAKKVLTAYATHYGDDRSFPPGADEMKKIVEQCQQYLK